MTEYNEGDLVEAVRDDTVIRGRATSSFGKHLLGLSGRIMEELEDNGFTLTVIEKAAPKNVLPSEPGIYVTYIDSPSPKIIHKLADGRWVNADDTFYMHDDQVAKFLPLTRLEPVPVTAKKFSNRVLEVWKEGTKTLRETLSFVDAEFGVDQ